MRPGSEDNTGRAALSLGRGSAGGPSSSPRRRGRPPRHRRTTSRPPRGRARPRRPPPPPRWTSSASLRASARSESPGELARRRAARGAARPGRRAASSARTRNATSRGTPEGVGERHRLAEQGHRADERRVGDQLRGGTGPERAHVIGSPRADSSGDPSLGELVADRRRTRAGCPTPPRSGSPGPARRAARPRAGAPSGACGSHPGRPSTSRSRSSRRRRRRRCRRAPPSPPAAPRGRTPP